MLEVLFWLSLFLLVYTYAEFPMLLLLRSHFCPKPIRAAEVTPRVSLVIVAHNEAGVIRKKLENVLSLDYPKDRLEVIVASDGSDDRTTEIVCEFAEQGVLLAALPRKGKNATLNEIVPLTHGEILAFSDANNMYATDALRNLVRPFADPQVGGVAGNQCYLKDGVANSATSGECAYWGIDRQMKLWESQAGNVIAATGAIYAIRRQFFKPLTRGVSDDATNSYRVIIQGFRLVFEPRAVAYEHVGPSESAEFRRKVRVCVKALTDMEEASVLLNPFRYGFYSLQLFSHKVLRWLAPWPLMLLLVTSFLLWGMGPFYELAALAQSACYGFALLTFVFRKQHFVSRPLIRPLTLPFFFCLGNLALLLGQIQFLRGQRIDYWEVRRGNLEQSIPQLDGSLLSRQ